jgi:hypothetical protein
LANESGSYLKQYAVDYSDWMVLKNVFNLLNYETIRMPNQDYIPLLITFFQEITKGGKLCLPPRLQPISIRSTKVDGNCAKYRTPIETLCLSLQKREHTKGKPITVLHLQHLSM